MQGFATPQNVPVYVDSDDNILKIIPAGSGTTEVQVIDASSAQTLTNKTLTSPAIAGAIGAGPIEIVTAANILTAAESGTTFYLNAAAGFLSTLPTPAAGLHYWFVVHTATSSNGYTIGTPTADIIYGMAVERAGGAGVAASAEDLITLVNGQMVKGDWMYLHSDGTSWYVFGMVDVAAGVTFTVT